MQGCDTGTYTDSTTGTAHMVNGSDQGYIARAVSGYSFKIEDASSNLLSGKDGAGRDVRRKAKYVVYTNGQTIDDLTVVATSAAITSGITINLPSPAGINTERELCLKNPSASTANIYFAGPVEAGTGSIIVTPSTPVRVISNGAAWIKI